MRSGVFKRISALCLALLTLLNICPAINAAAVKKKAVRIPVLLYHHFMEDEVPEERFSTTVEVSQFEEHIKTLTEKGYNSISLEDLRAYIKDGKKLPENPYMITIDDGYDSNYFYAFPILKKYNAKATIFVTVSMIRDEPGKHWNKNSLVWMTWNQLKEMECSGLVEIQNHGYIHKPASDITIDEFKESATKGQDILDEKLGVRKIKAFAYPHGIKTKMAERCLKENEFEMQFMVSAGSVSRNSDLADLPRIIVSYGKTGKDIINLINRYK